VKYAAWFRGVVGGNASLFDQKIPETGMMSHHNLLRREQTKPVSNHCERGMVGPQELAGSPVGPQIMLYYGPDLLRRQGCT